MTATATEIHRFVGRCKTCKQGIAIESAIYGTKTVWHCDKAVTLVPVQAKRTEKPCGARCIGATGPNCDCSCGGENHGAGHLG